MSSTRNSLETLVRAFRQVAEEFLAAEVEPLFAADNGDAPAKSDAAARESIKGGQQ